MTVHHLRWNTIGLAGLLWIAGCLQIARPERLWENVDAQHYIEKSTQIASAAVDSDVNEQIDFRSPPHTVLDRQRLEIRDISLQEAIHTALANSEIVRTRSQFGPGVSLERAASVYDPAIQATGVLFGGRGVEAALSDFDAQLNTAMIWGRNETGLNNFVQGQGLGAGSTFVSETGNFTAQLSKNFAYGGQFALQHNVNYLGTNSPSQLFPSSYSGFVQAQYRHPLLAGAGTEFTRIAGPITNSFRGISGVTQGVVIARINQDLSIADFQIAVRQLVKDVEDLYWDLYLAYRNYDTAVTARNSALRSWREAKAKLDVGGVQNFQPADEAQARDRYFETRAQAEQALGQIYTIETQLRRLMGLPVNDGTILRPSDEPITARLEPDWTSALIDALTKRAELRKLKWNIKSLELQLKAAENLTRPRLDFVGSYRVNGFGDRLFNGNPANGDFADFYGSLTANNRTGWSLGFQMTMAVGFRAALAQVRNIELRLAKARAQLSAQELDIAHEVADAFQQLALNYATAKSNLNRLQAARRGVELFEAEVRAGTKTLDILLRQQASLAAAESAYSASIVAYNKAIAELHLRTGTLLEFNNIYLEESDWDPEAYRDALRRAWERTHGIPAPWLHTRPEEFVGAGYDIVLPLEDQPEPPGTDDVSTPPAPVTEAGRGPRGKAPGSPVTPGDVGGSPNGPASSGGAEAGAKNGGGAAADSDSAAGGRTRPIIPAPSGDAGDGGPTRHGAGGTGRPVKRPSEAAQRRSDTPERPAAADSARIKRAPIPTNEASARELEGGGATGRWRPRAERRVRPVEHRDLTLSEPEETTGMEGETTLRRRTADPVLRPLPRAKPERAPLPERRW
ncbi:MAG: TolC family protein [Planctomycetota bacterium]|nr:MAG: TolC family protein [Planctomycetota bacterium]